MISVVSLEALLVNTKVRTGFGTSSNHKSQNHFSSYIMTRYFPLPRPKLFLNLFANSKWDFFCDSEFKGTTLSQ
jgi:hypothetical protein